MSLRGWTSGVLLVGGVSGSFACGGGQEQPVPGQQAPVFRPIDPSEAGVTAPGTLRFSGVLPCADCAGIRTELTLVQDPQTGQPLTYQLVETHLGSMSPEGASARTTSGRWSMTRGTAADPNISVYRLDGGGSPDAARSFERVGEQELRLLDRDGSRMESELPYTLTRASEPTLSFGAVVPAGQAPPAGAAGDQLPAAMVTDLASGWPVALRVGQQLTARLSADRAAGGRWTQRAGSDGGIVRLEGEPSFEATPGGGVEVFRLKAIKPGSTTLTFDYATAPGQTAVKSASYRVTVQ